MPKSPALTQFLAQAERVRVALGWTMAEAGQTLDPAVHEQAERALRGEIRRRADGSYAQIDLEHTDWTCQQTDNPGATQMYLLRFYILPALATAWRVTGDERYAAGARRYMVAYLRDFPTRDDWEPARYDRATQYDIRVGSTDNWGWLGSLPAFIGSQAFDEAFCLELLAAVQVHLRYLYSHVYPDRNIRILHGDVLLLNGFRLAHLPEAAAWRERGRRIINDALRRQVLADGAHLEAVPGYHNGVMHLLTNLWRLGRGLPELGLEIPTERLAAMYDYALATERPDGLQISLHDTGYAPSKANQPRPLGQERARFQADAGLPATWPPTVQEFPVAGQVFLRSAWDAAATYATFDATTRRSFHWHPCRNAVTLFANGRALLTDSGYPFRNAEFPAYGHRTEHHSTVTLNGWNQSQAPALLRVRRAPGYELVTGFYGGGYWPQEQQSHGQGLFGEHHRTLLWLREGLLVVLDAVNTTSESWRKPSVECVWQFSEGPLTLDGEARRAVTGHPDSNLLMLFPLVPAGTQLHRHEGEREPMRGWVTSEWGHHCSPAPMLRLAAPCYDPWRADLATVLLPFAGTTAPVVSAQATPPVYEFGERGAATVELIWGDGSCDRIIWIREMKNAIQEQHGVDTDASLIHLHLAPDGHLLGGLAVDGHYLEVAALGSGDVIGQVQRC
jgi:hypothetical protein